MKTHVVIYGEGDQTITTVPTTAEGEPLLDPSSPQARIVSLLYTEDSSDRDIVAKAAVTPDATTDTTTAACGTETANSRRIPVGTPGNFSEGSSYALVSTTGEAIEIIVDHVDGSYVYTDSEIRGNFPSGSTLRGFQISVTFPTAKANDEEYFDIHRDVPFAVDWFLGSGPVRELIYFRRAPERVYARPADVELLDITVGKLNQRNDKIEKALEQAHRDFRRLLRAKGINTDTVHFGENGRDWCVFRAAEILRRNLGSERDVEMADEYARWYRGIFNSLGKEGEVSLARDTDRATSDHYHRRRPSVPLT